MAAVRQVSAVNAKARVEPVALEVSAVPEAWAAAVAPAVVAARLAQAPVVEVDPSVQVDQVDRNRADVRVRLHRSSPVVRNSHRRHHCADGSDPAASKS